MIEKIVKVVNAFAVFFSFSIIFRTSLWGITIYYFYPLVVLEFSLVVYLALRKKTYFSLGLRRLFVLLVTFIFLSAMTYFSDSIVSSYRDEQFAKGIVSLIFFGVALITFVMYNCVLSDAKVHFYRAIVVSLKVNIAYGLIQAIVGLRRVWLNEMLVNFLRLNPPISENRLGQFLRVSGLTWDANFFAFQCMLFLFIEFLEIRAESRKRPSIFSILSALCIALSFSRSVILSCSFFILFSALIDRSNIKKWAVILTTVILILTIVTLTNYPVLSPILRDRFAFLDDSESLLEDEHFKLLRLGMELSVDNPFGIGINSISSYSLQQWNDSFFKLHNAFMTVIIENGLLAFISYILLFGKIVYFNRHYRNLKTGIALTIILSNVFYDQLLWTFTWLFLLILVFEPYHPTNARILQEQEIRNGLRN